MAIDKAMDPLAMEEEDFGPIEVEIGEEEQIEDIQPEPIQAAHGDNLAELLDDTELDALANRLLLAFDEDEHSRSEWLQTYVDGLDFLGFSLDDRTTPFQGASGVYHPILSEAVVRFQSNAIVEIFPAAGPVLTNILGKETDDKVEQAKRIKEEMNYQLTENMSEFRTEMERLLFRLPLAGSVFKKVYFDTLRGRPSAMMVPAEDFVVDYATSDLETSERYTHVMRKTKNEVKKMMRSGFYRTIDLQTPVPYSSIGKEKEDELKGVEPAVSNDIRHTLLEFYVHINLPDPFDDPDGVADPYIITVEKSSGKILSIYRNWAENDPLRQPEQYFVAYDYMPGLGFYAFGLIHLMGSIAKSATSILRQLIDAGTLANLPGGLKTRGMRTKNGDQPIQPGEWRDVDVPGGKIADNIFPLPYREPSATLAALLGNLVDEGRRIGSIAEMEIGSAPQNAPVGTTLALMERSLKVMSAVHARLHASLRRELKLIARTIGEYMPEQYEWDEEGQFNRRQDFDARIDILPVSDPNAATQAQRIIQMQAVQQLAQTAPELYNMKELHRVGLQAIGIKDSERLLPPDQDPPRQDPVSENMAILTGQPVKAYPDQDHQAHLDVHLAAMMDEKMMGMVGKSPNAPRLQGAMEAHIAEHLSLQYRAEIAQQMGVDLPELGQELPPEVENRLAKLMADAAQRVREEHKRQMEQEKAEEIMQDPVFQLRMREVANKERQTLAKIDLDQKKLLVEIAKQGAKEAMDERRLESEEMRAGAKIGADLYTFGSQLEHQERMEAVRLGKEIGDAMIKDDAERERIAHDTFNRHQDRKIKMRELDDRKAQRANQKGNSGKTNGDDKRVDK